MSQTVIETLTEVSSKLLIVDDEVSLRTLFSMALESDRQGVDCAEDGQRALEILKQTSFDLILLDLRMPGKSGLDVLRELRVRRDFTRVTIISAYMPGPAILKAIAMGVTHFLAKPMGLQPLRDFVDRQLRQSPSTLLEQAKEAAQLLDFEKATQLLKRQKSSLDLTSTIWLELFENFSLGKTIHDLDHLHSKLPLLIDGGQI